MEQERRKHGGKWVGGRKKPVELLKMKTGKCISSRITVTRDMVSGEREVLTTGHQGQAADKVHDGLIPGRTRIEDRDDCGIITQELYL